MTRPRWSRSFVEIVSLANYAWTERRFLAAAQEYWLAAHVAPTVADETRMLEMAWQADERSRGDVSELEQAG